MSEQVIEIAIKGEAEIVKMQSGDVLLVKVDAILSEETEQRIRKKFAKSLPAAVKILIADRHFDFSILRGPPASMTGVGVGRVESLNI